MKTLKNRIDSVFCYDSDEPSSSFNRPPEYVTVADITKKHRHGRSYIHMRKELLDIIAEATKIALGDHEEYCEGRYGDKCVCSYDFKVKQLEEMGYR